jgi:hypothetical protein
MGPRTGLEDVERRKILLLPGLELDHSAIQPVASRYIDCAVPAPIGTVIKMFIVIRSANFTCKLLN